MKIRISLFLIVLLCSCSRPDYLDLAIFNGTIYTVQGALSQVEAVGIKEGKIVYIGSMEAIEDRIGETTEMLDLEGQTMTPGWIEGHGHFMGMGYDRMELDLRDIANYQELVEKVADAVKNRKPGDWIVGRGWHQSKWAVQPDTLVKGFQTHGRLSAVSPHNPVFLRHASGHAGFANAKALEIAGISNIQRERSPLELAEAGEIIRDDLGNPTGILNEQAMSLVTRHIPENTRENDQLALKLAVAECLSNGITSFQDAGVGQKTIDLYQQSIDEGTMKVRLWAMLSGRDSMLLRHWYESGPLIGYGHHHLTIRSVKMYMDGALGTRGAWLLEDYTDRPGHRGHETTPIETLFEIASDALKNGFQVCSHAIGDRANREVLDQYQKAFEAYPQQAPNARFRIEHAQHINGEDIPRFGQLGVIAAMQAIHLSSDRPWAIDRLGMERILDGAYVWQKLLQSGAIIVNGSDVPVEPLDPLASFYASISRKTLQGVPQGGFEADQRMSREQALRSYTLDAAYGAFEEDLKGSIEIGKLADFTVFSANIMEIPEEEILKTRVVYTIVGGEVFRQH